MSVPTQLVFGKNESPFLGGGWHDRQQDQQAGFAFRATTSEARFSITLEPNKSRLLFLINAPLVFFKKEQSGVCLIEGHESQLLMTEEYWGVLEAAFLPSAEARIAEVVLKAKETATPDSYFHNGDLRPFGWMVSAIWQK